LQLPICRVPFGQSGGNLKSSLNQDFRVSAINLINGITDTTKFRQIMVQMHFEFTFCQIFTIFGNNPKIKEG
jgi:hypothetical protein